MVIKIHIENITGLHGVMLQTLFFLVSPTKNSLPEHRLLFTPSYHHPSFGRVSQHYAKTRDRPILRAGRQEGQ